MKKACLNHKKMVITQKIKYFKYPDVLFVKVPYLPEFKVSKYAKAYLKGEKIWYYVPEMFEYN